MLGLHLAAWGIGRCGRRLSEKFSNMPGRGREEQDKQELCNSCLSVCPWVTGLEVLPVRCVPTHMSGVNLTSLCWAAGILMWPRDTGSVSPRSKLKMCLLTLNL